METSTNLNWSRDRRLDILVLGPMGEDDTGPASTIPIRDALEALLEEDAFQDLLNRYNIQEDYKVHVPEGQNQSEIIERVLSLLDTADLVVFNLTPKPDQPDRSNVFYELGLVHALGIPAMLVVQGNHTVPFYVLGMRQYRVADFSVEALSNALRSPLEAFLDVDNNTSFTNDRVSQFYGMPVVDISAAVGLATGYYYNFLSRLITEGGFLAEYPGAIRAVIYVRPSSIESTYQADQDRLRRALSAEGLELEVKKLEPPKSDDKGMLWFDHIDGIVLDLPRTIYPLRRSPRLLSFLARNQSLSGDRAKYAFEQRLEQIGDNLLNHVEAALQYQVRQDGPRVRKKILHFTTIEEAPALVRRLLET